MANNPKDDKNQSDSKNHGDIKSQSDSKNQTEKSSSGSTTEKIGDTLKKIISSGSPSEISKEIIGTVVGQALKAKDDVTLKVTNEMIALVRKIDFVKEFSKFAENHKFKVTAEIEIMKKDPPSSDGSSQS